VDGLEAVAHVRQRARDDDAHRVVDERLLHLVDDLAFEDSFAALLYRHLPISLNIGLAPTSGRRVP